MVSVTVSDCKELKALFSGGLTKLTVDLTVYSYFFESAKNNQAAIANNKQVKNILNFLLSIDVSLINGIKLSDNLRSKIKKKCRFIFKTAFFTFLVSYTKRLKS